MLCSHILRNPSDNPTLADVSIRHFDRFIRSASSVQRCITILIMPRVQKCRPSRDSHVAASVRFIDEICDYVRILANVLDFEGNAAPRMLPSSLLPR